MSTTIQLSQETKQILDEYRESTGLETYEDAITHLLRQLGQDSAYGSMNGWGSWEEEDRMKTRSDEEEI